MIVNGLPPIAHTSSEMRAVIHFTTFIPSAAGAYTPIATFLLTHVPKLLLTEESERLLARFQASFLLGFTFFLQGHCSNHSFNSAIVVLILSPNILGGFGTKT